MTELMQAKKPEAGWETKNAPDLVKFDKPGVSIAGRLLSCSMIEIEKKHVIQYLITADGKKVFKFLGTFDLAQKLGKSDVGSLVRIEYLGEDKNVSRNGNSMKVFDVQTKRDGGMPAQTASNTITDEDIPF